MSYNKKSFRNVVLYLAKNGGIDVGKKKLAKLLYFIDFTLYELRKKPLTGMNYAKKDFGPMPEPALFYKALDDLEKSGTIKISRSPKAPLEKIIAKDSPKMEIFSREEKETIGRISKKYYFESGGSLEKIAQSEPPYKMVNYGDEIPYHLAFYRNTFGEMDLND